LTIAIATKEAKPFGSRSLLPYNSNGFSTGVSRTLRVRNWTFEVVAGVTEASAKCRLFRFLWTLFSSWEFVCSWMYFFQNSRDLWKLVLLLKI